MWCGVPVRIAQLIGGDIAHHAAQQWRGANRVGGQANIGRLFQPRRRYRRADPASISKGSESRHDVQRKALAGAHHTASVNTCKSTTWPAMGATMTCRFTASREGRLFLKSDNCARTVLSSSAAVCVYWFAERRRP